MTLHIEDKWLWDFWFAKDESDYHIFYLQSRRGLAKEYFRHWNVSVGHAVSQDLRNWEILPDALRPATPGHSKQEAWDSYTTWTGSIIKHDGCWYQLYTGGKLSEHGLIQRIGCATSEDLMTWHKHPDNPLICSDSRWYEQLDLTKWHDEAWRDPWVFYDNTTAMFHAFITARSNQGAADGRGVIAHAQSPDLLTWEVVEPVTSPGEFGDMEVPQMMQVNGRCYLLFSTSADHHSLTRQQRNSATLVTGTHYLVADQPLGPYHYLTDEFLVGDTRGSLYSAKLIHTPDGKLNLMAFRGFDENGGFIGDITDPMPVSVSDDGRLSVET